MLVWGAADATPNWRRRSGALTVVAAMALALSVVMTWNQLAHWQNSITLFIQALAVTTNNAPAHINLGVALEKEGRWDEALQHYQAAFCIEPRQPQIHNNIGNVLDAMGRTEEAIVSYQRALQLRPGVALVHNNLGLALVTQGKFDEALAHYGEAMRLAPLDPEPRFLAAKAFLSQNKPEQALEHFRQALHLDSRHAKSLTWYARLLAANRNPAFRNGAEAVRLAERAVEVTNGEQPLTLDVLAMAYAEAGRFDDAIRVTQQTVEFLKRAGEKKYAAEMEARLQFYRAAQPFRE